jgi:large subunit ribosomal protein L25
MKAEERLIQSKGDLRKLREQGKVPGVVYGKKIDKPTAVAVPEKELQQMLRSHPHAIVEMEVPSAGKQPVMMTSVQRDPLTRHLIHIDFHQINMDEEVKTAVRLDVAGEAPGVKEGGILQVMLHELEVHCLPRDIPESIEVDISGLQVGENILLSDVKLPSGVETKVEGSQVLVTVLAPQKDVVEDEPESDASAQVDEANGKESPAEEVK